MGTKVMKPEEFRDLRTFLDAGNERDLVLDQEGRVAVRPTPAAAEPRKETPKASAPAKPVQVPEQFWD